MRAGDVPRLTEVLDRLLSDPAERGRLGEAARRTVAEHFTWERCGERRWRSTAPCSAERRSR